MKRAGDFFHIFSPEYMYLCVCGKRKGKDEVKEIDFSCSASGTILFIIAFLRERTHDNASGFDA